MSDFFVVPPDEVEQWEAELGLSGLIHDLRRAMEATAEAEKSLADWQARAHQIRQAVSLYRERLGLPDTPIPMPGSAGDPLGRASERLRHAVLEGQRASFPETAVPAEGKNNG